MKDKSRYSLLNWALASTASHAPASLSLLSLSRSMALVMAGLALATQAFAAETPQQTIRLGASSPYSFVTFANADLGTTVDAERAVVLVHGVKRNADEYFQSGLNLLKQAGLAKTDTLLLAPNFLTERDKHTDADIPLWPRDEWMQGTPSSGGRPGIHALGVLDDWLAYLGDRKRFPRMQEIILIGHSAGGQLVQRYSLLGRADQALATHGITVRYVVSSPSSYLYLDDNRWQADAFQPPADRTCPDYNRYRYGLEGSPAYLTEQNLSPEQLLHRYAARDVTYMVGALDNNPDDRVMDRSCSAMLQGRTRVERQLAYMRYEQFLATKWGMDIHHRQFQVTGAGHNDAHLFNAKSVANELFP